MAPLRKPLQGVGNVVRFNWPFYLGAGGAALALAGLWLGPRMAGALALAALIGLVVLVHLAPTDPYFADSLQGWEQGRFVRFHGLAQWVGWLWPYAAMAWLLGRPRTR